MHEHLEVISAFGLGLGLAMALVPGAAAQQNPVTAIDIALEPDATMVQHAMADNARLLKSFPKGFSLDATHHPHVSMLQQFVRTDDLDKIYAAAQAVFDKEKPKSWTLKAFKYYYIPSPPIGLAGIVVEPTEDLHRLQDALIKAVEPYTVKTGTAAACYSEDGGRDIQPFLIGYVENFVRDAAGKLQSACDDRRWHGKISERNAGGAIPVVHVLSRRRVGLSAWLLRHGSEGAQSADVVALRSRKQNRTAALAAMTAMCAKGRSDPFAVRMTAMCAIPPFAAETQRPALGRFDSFARIEAASNRRSASANN
jgi:hypothetical protein